MTVPALYTFDGNRIEGPFTIDQLTSYNERNGVYYWTSGLDRWVNKYQLYKILGENAKESPEIPSPPNITIIPVIPQAFFNSVDLALSEINTGKTINEVLVNSIIQYRLQKDFNEADSFTQKIGELQLTKAISVICSDYSIKKFDPLKNDDQLNQILSRLKSNKNTTDIYEVISKGWIIYPLSEEMIEYYSNKIESFLTKEEIYKVIKSESLHPLISLKLIIKLADNNNRFSFSLSNIGKIKFKHKKLYQFWLILNIAILCLSNFKINYINKIGFDTENFWPFVDYFECSGSYWQMVDPYRKECFLGIFTSYDATEFFMYTLIPLFIYFTYNSAIIKNIKSYVNNL